MAVGVLVVHIEIPGCRSLKEKRSRLKPLLARLHREFNVAAAELDLQDSWQEAVVGIAAISNDRTHTQRLLLKVPVWIESTFPDITLIDERIQML